MQALLNNVIGDLQSWILAFYKKEYQSQSDHPPLGYYMEVFRISPHPELKPNLLMVVKISPDTKVVLDDVPRDVSDTCGHFYYEGVGTIEIEHSGESAVCLMRPAPHLTIKKKYRSGDGRA